MEKIKLFEDFIFEVSSKKLEEINTHLEKMFEKTNAYSIIWMLHFIMAANANSDDEIKRISNKHNGFIDGIVNDDELTFDMDKAIDNYKKLKDYNDGNIKTGDRANSYIKETDFEKKTLEVIENILNYYKKNKNVESVTFHDFAKYVYKMLRILHKTDKDSEASINNIIGVILKNGIDILNIEKEINKYRDEYRDKENISILTTKCLKAGQMDGDERDNDSGQPVFYTTFWKGYSNFQLVISLFVQKKEYFLGMGCVGNPTHIDTVIFNKEGEQTSFHNENRLKRLGFVMKKASEEFGDDKFEKILNDIFEIFAKNGADVKFNYEDLKKNMKNYL